MTAIEIAQHYYRCFNNKDWAGMLALLSADIRHDVNQGETRVGVDLYRSFLAHMDDCYDERLDDLVFFTEPLGGAWPANSPCTAYKNRRSYARPERYTLPAGAFLEVADSNT